MTSMICRLASIGNLLKAVVEEGTSLAIVWALARGRELVGFRVWLRVEGITVAEVDSYRPVA